MKRLLSIIAFIIICSHRAYAWNLLEVTGSRNSALANCSVSLSDFWSCHNNIAGCADLNDIGVGFSYQNKFLLKELGYKNAGITCPLDFGVVIVSASQFGYKLYNENVIGIGFARHFGHNLRIGLKFDYLFFNFSNGYKDKSIPTFEVGMQYQINESLCLGAFIFNPINVRLRTINKEKIPIIFRFGFSYYINKEFLITSEIEENSEYDFSYRIGLEYEVYKHILIRSGFQLNPGLFAFGIGYNFKRYTIDISAQMNHILGSSLSCSFNFKI